jgi:hypothetical protein
MRALPELLAGGVSADPATYSSGAVIYRHRMLVGSGCGALPGNAPLAFEVDAGE